MTGNADSDRELLEKFRNGDHEAFRQLTDPLVPALEVNARRGLDRRLRRKVSVADLVQEARMVAFQRREDFRDGGDGSLRRWLLGILQNRVKKAVEQHVTTGKRAVRNEITRGQRTSTVNYRARQATPSAIVGDAELRALATRARDMLSADERELLRLVHDEQLNLKQAAEHLGRSYEAVRKQHARAVMRLGQAIRRMRGNDDDTI